MLENRPVNLLYQFAVQQQTRTFRCQMVDFTQNLMQSQMNLLTKTTGSGLKFGINKQ